MNDLTKLLDAVADAPPLPAAWRNLFATFTINLIGLIDDGAIENNEFYAEYYEPVVPDLLLRAKQILGVMLQHTEYRSEETNRPISPACTLMLSTREEDKNRKMQTHRRPLEFPPEILHCILSFVRCSRTVASCCAVNRSWSSVAKFRLWQNFVPYNSSGLFRFLCGVVSSQEYASRQSLEDWDVTPRISELTIAFGSATFGRFVQSHLHLFLGLRSLHLFRFDSWEPLEPLFSGEWESFTRLTRLSVEVSTFDDSTLHGRPSNYNSERATQKFSQFTQIMWDSAAEDLDFWQPIVDSAHHRLEVAGLPEAAPFDVVDKFLRN